MTVDNKLIAKIFKAICDENRVAIIRLLQTGEKCACNIGDALGLSQSKLSYHMKILCESGLVECWYVGKWTHYQICKSGCEYATSLLKSITNVSGENLPCECSKNAI